MHKPSVFYLPSLLVALVGCGQARLDPAGGADEQGVLVSGGGSITLATYTIAGPNGFASAGSVPVGESLDVPVSFSHLPVGAGYLLTLTATSSDGVTVCDGNETFDVTDGSATLTLLVHLVCAVPTGNVNVEASLNLCPVVDDFSASPLVLDLGGVSRLSVVAHDSDHAPGPLAYTWSVNGVGLPSQTAPILAFTCSSNGEVTLAAHVSDGDPHPDCAASSSVKVTCE